jgi:uncharacterized protein (DUF4213/DUF364 family)
VTIIEQTYNLLESEYKSFAGLKISDVRVGQYLTAVALSDGSIGIASSLEDEHPFCSKEERDFGDFTPLKITGRNVLDLLRSRKDSKLMASLKIAVLNAISSGIILSGKYRIVENCDPADMVDYSGHKTVTIVGAFQSYIRKISETESKLFVLELNENAFKDEDKKYFVPASEYGKIIPLSDVIIVTGQTLVNGTIDELLNFVKKDSEVIVTGPSGSILPDVLFKNGVSKIGAIRITKPGLVFDVVGQGGLGYHLFRYCAQKICILKGNE